MNKCRGNFNVFDKVVFVSEIAKNVLLDFSKKVSCSRTLPWTLNITKKDFLNCSKSLWTPCVFSRRKVY